MKASRVLHANVSKESTLNGLNLRKCPEVQIVYIILVRKSLWREIFGETL
jgi:hypothetical protein